MRLFLCWIPALFLIVCFVIAGAYTLAHGFPLTAALWFLATVPTGYAAELLYDRPKKQRKL